MSCYAIIPIQQIKLQCYMTRPRVTTKPLAETDNSNPTLHHSCMITENRVAHTQQYHTICTKGCGPIPRGFAGTCTPTGMRRLLYA